MNVTPAYVLDAAGAAIYIFAEVLGAGCLFAHGQQTKPHVLLRALGILILFSVLSFSALCLTGMLMSADDLSHIISAASGGGTLSSVLAPLLFCAIALAATLPALNLLFDMSMMASVYCATAGYALQNLASSILELIALMPFASAIHIPPLVQSLAGLAYYAAFFWIAWRLFIRKIDPRGLAGHLDPTLLPMIAVVVFGIIGFDLILKCVVTGALPKDVVICLRLVHILVCVFVLAAEVEIVAVHQLESEKATAERLLAERERQYEMSRETIDAINIKCHDLRHQIRSLATGAAVVDKAVLDDAAKDIRVYDATVRTGNDVLDTILTEKSLVCQSHGITLTCIADGEALSGMQAADLYAFFGNALDNAIRAVEALPDQNLRSISVIVKRKMGMASIHIENYCDQSAVSIRTSDGLPETTKADAANHGFGTRSMRSIVERYGGTISFSAKGATFCVDALVPMKPADS